MQGLHGPEGDDTESQAGVAGALEGVGGSSAPIPRHHSEAGETELPARWSRGLARPDRAVTEPSRPHRARPHADAVLAQPPTLGRQC